jgi:hypothetical protein
VPALFLDDGLDQPGLIAVNIMLAQDFFDSLNARLDARFIRCGAILT